MNSYKFNFVLSLLLFSTTTSIFSQNQYKLPPKSISDLVLAANDHTVKVSKSGNFIIILEKSGLMTIEELSEDRIGLAGFRITTANNSIFNKVTYEGISLKDLKNGKEIALKNLPSKLRISDVEISPDNRHIAFQQIYKDRVELWIANTTSGLCKKLSHSALSDISGNTFQWNPDGKSILAQFIPKDRIKPILAEVPDKPISQENSGKITPARTYQNLLSSEYDEKLFDYYATAQLMKVSLDGKEELLGKPAIYKSFDYSPDSEYLIVSKTIRPYSYSTPASMFGSVTEIINKKGDFVKKLSFGKFAKNKPTGVDAVVMGPRSYAWRDDKPSSLTWLAANDEGDPQNKVEIRDVLYALKAPFNGKPETLYQAKYRISGITWANENLALVTQKWNGITRRYVFNPSNTDQVSNTKKSEIQAPIGVFSTINEKGKNLLLVDSNAVGAYILYISGKKTSSEDVVPYFLKWEVAKNKKDTIFKSKAPYYEQVIQYLPELNSLLFSRESAEMNANYYLKDLKRNKELQITSFAKAYPTLEGVEKKFITYYRADSVKLSAYLYLPKGYKKTDGLLPMFMWAYPWEFKTEKAAEQLKTSPYQFTRIKITSPIYWVTRGYAVLDNASMPIIAKGNKDANETYIEQLIEDAKAAIKVVVDMGVVDSNRIAVGGHSYGAFMTANLLAHTKLFAAGIASSGAYNRTLTPFGFQHEKKNYWEAMEMYNKMSPFNYANQIKSPILLLHGMSDDNSGTFPVQSERFYDALKGLGATTKLVLFPKEEHTYRAKESVLHRLYEMDLWLEKYVKNKGRN